MALTPGTRLGVYDITAAIGEGGMGQVYRATDAKLKRQVAIKVLPPSLAADADRLARFQREAEVLACLNHPNIAAIYDLEESGGTTALVMELVEGDDLSQRIARGAMPLDEALPIAKQIAEALEAAHEQGIIHRDLKPANIKVRGDGAVKVLDFGLAKAMDPAGASGANAANSPTLTAHATALGMILGTAAYMAPEQAKGKAVDKRADIWAFGVVLYEMLAGRAAFAGDTITDIIAAVVTREPEWTALPAATPASIRRLLARCLEKDPKRRVRDIGDVRFEIDETIARGSSDARCCRIGARSRAICWCDARRDARLDSAVDRRRRTAGRWTGVVRRVATRAPVRVAPTQSLDRSPRGQRSDRTRDLARRSARCVQRTPRRRDAAAVGAGSH